MRALAMTLLGVLWLGACSSPEATRVRAGGSGSDVRNVGDTVEMHAGSQPYWETPRLIEPGGPLPAASPAAASAEPDKHGAGTRR